MLAEGAPGAEVRETKMFGGLAFLVDGHMVIAASGRGGGLVRTDPAGSARLIERGAAEPMVMRGRPLDGWLRLPSEALRTTRQVRRWVDAAVAYVATLPPKQSPAARRRRSRP